MLTFTRCGRLVLSLAIIGTSLAAHGCVRFSDSGSWDYAWNSDAITENRQLGIEHVPGSPIKVVTKNGSIVLRKSGTSVVDVRAVVRARTEEKLREIKVVAQREESGTLLVKAEFPENRARDGAGVSLEILIPDATGLDLSTSNGAVTAEGFSGSARLDSSNGAITLKDHDGDAVLDSSNGRIIAERVTGSVKADTSNGSVTLADIGTPVVADTSNGAIDVRLADDAPGPVTLDSSNGKVTLAVGSGFSGVIVADTSNAGVDIDLGDHSTASVVTSQRGRHAKITFLADGPRSEIDTSNGSIVIKKR